MANNTTQKMPAVEPELSSQEHADEVILELIRTKGAMDNMIKPRGVHAWRIPHANIQMLKEMSNKINESLIAVHNAQTAEPNASSFRAS